MSHRVEPSELAAAAEPRGATPFLVYAGMDGSARINHVHVVIEEAGDDTVARCTGFGRGVVSHVEAGGTLSLLWPPSGTQTSTDTETSGHTDRFSLIADGIGSISDDELRIVISGAVLHRPAPSNGGSATC